MEIRFSYILVLYWYTLYSTALTVLYSVYCTVYSVHCKDRNTIIIFIKIGMLFSLQRRGFSP